MSDWAYHQEALRRARVMQRQAQATQSAQKKERSEPPFGVCPKRTTLEPVGEEHYKFAVGSHQPYDNKQAFNYAVYKDLQCRASVLRNHNMYLGPMTAFKDLFIEESKPSDSAPSRSG